MAIPPRLLAIAPRPQHCSAPILEASNCRGRKAREGGTRWVVGEIGVEVDEDVEVKPDASAFAANARGVPCPDLVGCRGSQAWQGFGRMSSLVAWLAWLVVLRQDTAERPFGSEVFSLV